MVSEIYTVVNNSIERPRMGTKFNQQRKLELFPPVGPLEIVAIDILRSLPRTRADNYFFIIMRERYNKLARLIPMTKITSTRVADILFND